ncbi:MAG: leishmanolysin-related zinc metalloendopeptidase [Gemmatimonadaceae bacterium]|nr:leishmanolysin-related zinc metalloendopeptidase [Gemmatimonadaceae bacterium]
MTRSPHLAGPVVLLVLAAAIGGCGDSTSPPKPASVAADQVVAPDGTAGAVLAVAPTFEVKDAGGSALGGVKVTVAVTAGGGILTDAPTATKGGPTPVGTWKLGTAAGLNSVTVTVGSLPPLVITVNGKPGPPASVAVVGGASQTALAGTTLPVAPTVQVRDQFLNGVPGVPVTFTVLDGDGTVSNAPVSTDASGNAVSPAWQLGKSAVPQSLRASTTGGFAAIVPAAVATGYDMDLRFFGPPLPPVTAGMFTAASARIRGAVIGDVGDIAAPATPVNLEAGCGTTGLPTAFIDPVDDVVIFASVGPIDGALKILAFAGPCFIRGPNDPANRQTVIGVMKFDSDDIETLIARGNLTDVIQHEMLHVVGVGTLWSFYGVLAGAGTTSSRFTGAMGIGACVTLGGSPVCPGSVPVENCTNCPGTADGHWRESVFATELMTGFVTSPTPGFTGILNPLSTITIQSLADIGYNVNPAAADPYFIPGLSAARALGQLNVDTSGSWEQVIQPRMQVTPRGQISIIRQQ